MPLIRQYWLARKDKRKVALKPDIDRDNNRVDFKVVEGLDVTGDPAEATTSRGDTRCLLCSQVAKGADVRRLSSEGKMAASMTAVVLESKGGKSYREDTNEDSESFTQAAKLLAERARSHVGDLPFLPDEPMPKGPETVAGRGYGIETFSELFNARQLLALTTFARQVGEAHAEMLRSGMDGEYAKALATYLAFALDRLANTNSTLARLMSSGGRGIVGTFARQALPMVWDYAEANPFGTSASWSSALTGIIEPLEVALSASTRWPIGNVAQSSSQNLTPRSPLTTVITDPPYYDAINYADLSDFFYVWLKRSIGFLHPGLLALPLTPPSGSRPS